MKPSGCDKDNHLNGGLKAVTDGAVHGFQAIWGKKVDQDRLGIISCKRKKRGSTTSTKLECCEQSVIYGHPELNF